MNKESLSFEVSLRSTHWRKIPHFKIFVNDTLIKEDSCDKSTSLKFNYAVEDGVNHLKIQLINKEDTDCVQNKDKTEILKDMLLHIDSISIDNVNLDHVIHTCSQFVPQDPSRPVLKECVDLGWNGTYVLEFTSPFYIWLLENM